MARERIGESILDAVDEAVGPKWDNVLLGKGARISWGGTGASREAMWLEELPGKPVKKQVRAAWIDTAWWVSPGGLDDFIVQNLVQDAKLSASMSYDEALSAMKKAIGDAMGKWDGKKTPRGVDANFEKMGGIGSMVQERTRSYLEVEPEDYKPIEVNLKGGALLKAEWDKFSSYSPSSDFQQADPFYMEIASTSKAAARKLFKMLKADPGALAAVSWDTLTDWLRKQGIASRTNHSQWS